MSPFSYLQSQPCFFDTRTRRPIENPLPTIVFLCILFEVAISLPPCCISRANKKNFASPVCSLLWHMFYFHRHPRRKNPLKYLTKNQLNFAVLTCLLFVFICCTTDCFASSRKYRIFSNLFFIVYVYEILIVDISVFCIWRL